MKNGYNYDVLTNTLTISASFARKAAKVGSPEYSIILKLRRDFPNLTIQQEAKHEGKKSITFTQMEAFIAAHRNADELKAQYDKVRKLSRVQPMPYKYVKTWFEDRFPYYNDQPAFDEDGYVVDHTTAERAEEMERAVKHESNIVPMEGEASAA